VNNEELSNFESDIAHFATRYSADRLKISTVNFDRDYQRQADGRLHLVKEKAIIRVLGKVTKVSIGEGEQYATYEDAFEATKKHWQEYYKNVRANRSEAEKVATARRQKRYRERRRAKAQELKERQ
jgi:hypothetical protein